MMRGDDVAALVAIMILVMINGFFVAAEFALVSLRSSGFRRTDAGRRESGCVSEYLIEGALEHVWSIRRAATCAAPGGFQVELREAR